MILITAEVRYDHRISRGRIRAPKGQDEVEQWLNRFFYITGHRLTAGIKSTNMAFAPVAGLDADNGNRHISVFQNLHHSLGDCRP